MSTKLGWRADLALAQGVQATYLMAMTVLARIATAGIATILIVGGHAASARPKSERPARSPAPTIVQTCNGTPVIMQGLPCPTGPVRVTPSERAERPQRIPRGSSGYFAPAPLPTTPSFAPQAPAVAPYIPPRIDSFSDRVTRCNQSFTFNAGVGNNPSDRDAYVRSCAN